MSVKLISFWVFGAVLMTVAMWILSNLRFTIGVSQEAYWIALLISFVLFLLAGLCWISVAVATKQKFD